MFKLAWKPFLLAISDIQKQSCLQNVAKNSIITWKASCRRMDNKFVFFQDILHTSVVQAFPAKSILSPKIELSVCEFFKNSERNWKGRNSTNYRKHLVECKMAYPMIVLYIRLQAAEVMLWVHWRMQKRSNGTERKACEIFKRDTDWNLRR